MRTLTSAYATGLLGLAGLLGGCGDSGSSAGSEQRAGDPRGVIASASDCVSFGEKAVKACAKAIERAVDNHESSSASYGNIDACEAAVGADKCERSASGKYRARLSAFMVSIEGSSAHAEPLYPAKDGAVGFQTASKTPMLANDRSLVFSRLALSVAETQAADSKSAKSHRKKVY
ncbi:MAG: DUF1190 domain-containing protein [Hyphomicrobium sp.]|uniref:DUF1190 domain-containing protein n=1 Tax=Hyphomicrobium sp. TaxID=82 RepID=UPI003D14E7EC